MENEIPRENQRRIENKKLKIDSKKIWIFVLIILTFFLLLYTIFTSKKYKDGIKERKEFIQNINNSQTLISYYLATTIEKTYGTYKEQQVITGLIDDKGSELKDNQGKKIVPVVSSDKSNVVEENSFKYYLVIDENLKTVLNLSLDKIEGAKYYLSQDGIIKIKFNKIPSWWDHSLESYQIGIK